jgi:hypothetical protein
MNKDQLIYSIERIVNSYTSAGVLNNKQAGYMMSFIHSIVYPVQQPIGGIGMRKGEAGDRSQPEGREGRIIQEINWSTRSFNQAVRQTPVRPTIIPFPQQEQKPPEPSKPPGWKVWAYLKEQGFYGSINMEYALYDLGGYDLEKIAALSARAIARCKGVGPKSIAQLRAFLRSKGLDLQE